MDFFISNYYSVLLNIFLKNNIYVFKLEYFVLKLSTQVLFVLSYNA